MKTFDKNIKAGINGNGHSYKTIEEIELIGDNHVASSAETPLRADAFDKSDSEKMALIQFKNPPPKVVVMSFEATPKIYNFAL